MDRDHADRAPDAHGVRHEPDGRGVARDFEGHVHALAVRPVVGELDHVHAGAHDLEPQALEEIDAEGVDLRDDDAGAAVAGDERDQRADGPAAEDEHRVSLLHLRARDVVSRDGQRLHHGGVVVGERAGHLDQALGWHRPVFLHASRHVDAEHLELVAEPGRAHRARAACVADAQGLDHDAVALDEAAPGRRLRDLGKGLVADDATPGHAMVEMPLEDVQVRATDADALDLEQRFPGRRRGDGGGPRAEVPRALVERGAHD